MNILFCYKCGLNPNEGGVGRVSDILARYFSSLGVRVYYLFSEKDLNDSYIYLGERYFLPNSIFLSKDNLRYYREFLIKMGIDIVINHDASNERSRLWLNTGKCQVKKISLHHNDPLHGLIWKYNYGIMGYINRLFPNLIYKLKVIKREREIGYLLNNSDRLVLLSSEFKRQIAKEIGINSSRIVAISNPIIIHKIQDITRKKLKILFVARMEISQKRPEKMLGIWSRLYKKFPNWELIFLGDGPDMGKILEMAKNLKLERVRFEGFVDPIPYYQKASIICMTSDYEGFGLVLPEAMQFGVVPITFNNWISLVDIIEDDFSGILVETGKTSDYVVKLDHLMSDEKLRKRISRAAVISARKFDIGRIGPLWINLFKELISENSSSVN
jgi:glycosyltransferase involved in cell wall biosynthesis